MRISHVIRGEDHVSNTPKHILLFEALGYPLPVFGHLPLILNPDGTKMSKRKSQTAVADYVAQGFLREALVNYFAFLGWSPGTEEDVLTLDEIASRFELDKVHKGGARFDRERLEWLNGQWIRRLDDDDLVDRLLPFLEAAQVAGQIDRLPTGDEVRTLLPIVRERIPTLASIVDVVGFLWLDDPAVDPAALVPKRWDAATTREALAAARGCPRRPRCRDLGGRRAGAAAARARWRPAAGRPATCSWRSASPRPGRPRRRRCSTRWSRSAATGRSPGWTRRSRASARRPERPCRAPREQDVNTP